MMKSKEFYKSCVLIHSALLNLFSQLYASISKTKFKWVLDATW